MLAVVWPFMWLAFLPVVAIEALVAMKMLQLRLRRALVVTAAANAVSTLVGIPVTWFVLLGIEWMPYFIGIPDDTRWQTAIAVTTQWAWISPFGNLGITIPMAAIVLCVPFYFVSVWVEYLVARRMVANDFRQVRRFSWWANFWSYSAIVVFWAGRILTSMHATSQPNADGQILARHDWPESLVALLRDAEQKQIKIDHLNVYLGQHDNCFWRCNATPKLLDLMVARWELHPVKRSDKMVDLALRYMPTDLSSSLQGGDIDYYVSTNILPGGEWKGHQYCVFNDKSNGVIVVKYYYNF